MPDEEWALKQMKDGRCLDAPNAMIADRHANSAVVEHGADLRNIDVQFICINLY